VPVDRRWFVGIDWASEAHAVCVVGADGGVVGERTVPHSGAGLAELTEWVLEIARGDAASVHVAIEVPHGAVVETLLERGLHVYAINPKQLDRFRDRFTVAGAKDDRRDARVLADSLRTDAPCFRRLQVDAPLVIELREWSRMTEDLGQERVRLANRIRQQLQRYYPQMLRVRDDIASEPFLALWELMPTPAVAARVRTKSIERVLRQHRLRSLDAEQVQALVRETPLTVAPGTTEAAVAHIHLVAARLRVVNQQLTLARQRLDELCEALAASRGPEDEPGQSGEQRDVEILRSLPGVGRIVLATLLAEAAQPLRERDYHALRALAGAAPITRQSGKSRVVVMRQACHLRLRRALYHWARVAAMRDPGSRAAYAALRARGHSHGRALRTIGDRLLAVACAMLRSQTAYDPQRRRAA
jgi:transposase